MQLFIIQERPNEKGCTNQPYLCKKLQYLTQAKMLNHTFMHGWGHCKVQDNPFREQFSNNHQGEGKKNVL